MSRPIKVKVTINHELVCLGTWDSGTQKLIFKTDHLPNNDFDIRHVAFEPTEPDWFDEFWDKHVGDTKKDVVYEPEASRIAAEDLIRVYEEATREHNQLAQEED